MLLKTWVGVQVGHCGSHICTLWCFSLRDTNRNFVYAFSKAFSLGITWRVTQEVSELFLRINGVSWGNFRFTLMFCLIKNYFRDNFRECFRILFPQYYISILGISSGSFFFQKDCLRQSFRNVLQDYFRLFVLKNMSLQFLKEHMKNPRRTICTLRGSLKTFQYIYLMKPQKQFP